MNHSCTLLVLLFMLTTIALIGCDVSKKFGAVDESLNYSETEKVIARANHIEVTQQQLDRKLSLMLGDFQSSLLDANTKKQALDSLMVSKIIAEKVNKDLSDAEKREVSHKIQNYRESLLINQYIRSHAKIEPVTAEMVNAYYQKHHDKYGAKTIKKYQMIFSTEKLTVHDRSHYLQQLALSSTVKNWKQYVKQLNAQGEKFKYVTGQMGNRLLKPQLRTVIDKLKIGETSKVIFVDNKPYVIRIEAVEKVAPKPLEIVSSEIRKTLAPLQLKKAVKKISKQILDETKIEYIN